jgi:hypothetical protein
MRGATENSKYAVDIQVQPYLYIMSEERLTTLQQNYDTSSAEERQAAKQNLQTKIRNLKQARDQVFSSIAALQKALDFNPCHAFVKSVEIMLFQEFMDVFICQMTHSYQLRMGLIERVKAHKHQHGW